MKTVITYGTFDLFHIGHVRLLKRLKGLGDRLVVGCSTDEFNAIKSKKAIYTYEARSEILRACSYVDEVFPENNWDQKVIDIRRFKADILAMGDDWTGKFDTIAEEAGCVVTYLARTPDISTTDVKSVIRGLQAEKLNSVMKTIDHLKAQVDGLLN
jgi:glycerol-3-phosphate cytidylyltransferase